MGAKLNFKETKKELDRRIEESRNNLNDAQAEPASSNSILSTLEMVDLLAFFRGQHEALVELRYSMEGGGQLPITSAL